MNERSYWDSCAETAELMLEGNRLISNEIAGYLRAGWRAVTRRVENLLHPRAAASRLPPN